MEIAETFIKDDFPYQGKKSGFILFGKFWLRKI